MRLIAVAGLLMPLALICGCGSPGRPQTLAWFGRNAAQSPDSTRADESPFRPSAPEAATASEIELTAGTRDVAADASRSGATLDTETEALIAQELADAPPEERRELLAEFENIDPAMIRQLLRIRRMVRRVGHHAGGPALMAASAGPADATAPGSEPMPAATATVGYSRGGPTAPAIAAAGPGGLGGVSPWRYADGTSAAPGPAPDFAQLPAPEGSPPSAGDLRSPPLPPFESGLPAAAAPVPVQLLPAEPEAEAARPANALARMVPRLDSFPNLFPMGGAGTPAAAGAAEPGAVPPPAPPAGSVSGLAPATTWQADLNHVIARVEAEVSHWQPPADPQDPSAAAYVEAHVYLRMLYLIAGRQEQAIAHIPGVSPSVQQFWQQMLWAMANAFDFENMPDPAERAAQTLLQLHAAAAQLREQSPLQLDNVAFCTKITSFGNYDRFDPYEFSPGQPVLLYAEAENFRSEPTTDQQGQNAFRTVLQSRVEILSPSGDIHYQMDFPPTEDLCRSRRRDYFHSYEFTIPPRMPYGHHVLVLTVEDRISQKLATYRLNFTVK